MNPRKQLVPWVVIAMVVASFPAPFSCAAELADSFATPGVSPSAAASAPAVDLGPIGDRPAQPTLSQQVALHADAWAATAAGLAVEDDEAAPVEKEGWSKAGKILTLVGTIVAVSGVIMIVAAPDEQEIGDSGVGIDWQNTGIVWSAAGGVVALIGLLKH